MNFKGWEKIKDDGKSATMKHPSGHEMTIIIKKLPSIQQEQIKRIKLAAGGEAYPYTKWLAGKRVKQEDKKPDNIQSELPTELKSGEEQSPSGEVSENNPDSQGFSDMINDTRNYIENNQLTEGLSRGGKIKRKSYDNGGGVNSDSSEDSPGQIESDASKTVGHNQPITINVGTPQSNTNAPVMPVPSNGPANYSQQAKAPELPLEKNKVNVPPLINSELNPVPAVNLQQKAIQEQADVEKQRAAQNAINEKAYVDERARLAQQDVDNYNELKGHTDAFAAYNQEQPLNENAYLENRSTGQKMRQGLALVLGGLGGGILGTGGNVALDFMNKQIDRNIDAQKQRFHNQATIWGAYHSLYGDANIATNLAKVSANDILTHQGQMLAAKLGTPQAQANADALSALKANENNQLLIDAQGRLGSLRNTGSNLGNVQGQGSKPGNMTSGAPSPVALPQEMKGYGPTVPGSATGLGSLPASNGNSRAADFLNEKNQYNNGPMNISTNEVGGSSKMLDPKIDDYMARLKYMPQIPDDVKHTMNNEYQIQRNAEAGMRAVDEQFPKLIKNRNWTGFAIDEGSHLLGKVAEAAGAGASVLGLSHLIGKGGVPVAAGATAGAMGGLASAVPVTALATMGLGGMFYWNKDQISKYNTAKKALRSAIATALKGVPGYGGDQAVGDLVDQYTPLPYDSASTLAEKAKAIKDIIRLHTTSTYLKAKKMSNN